MDLPPAIADVFDATWSVYGIACLRQASNSVAFIITMRSDAIVRTFPHRTKKSMPTTVAACSEIENRP
jgi:hypothetical protein